MSDRTNRRHFVQNATAAALGLVAGTAAAQNPDHPHGDQHEHAPDQAAGERAQAASAQEAPAEDSSAEYPRFHIGRGGPVGSGTDRGKLVGGFRGSDEPPASFETPDLPKLPWKMVGGVKEYHLVAEHVRREILPGMWFDFWGFNGSMPGPSIEAVQGDRVRIVVHNELPEPTTIHWHGLELPIRMDGVPFVTQDPIMPGKEFVYEFDLHQDGTFFYHSHGAMQEIMGMTGFFIIHPRRTYSPPVDYDFGLIFQEFFVLPQSTIPNSLSEEFNFFTINGRSGPYTTPMAVRLGSRVRMRLLNLNAMDHHPIHFHGHTFWITGTEGGRIPESAWIPSNNVLISVGQSRDFEFVANNPGDWMLHCHILHHMMNHMVAMAGPMGGGMGGGGTGGGQAAEGGGGEQGGEMQQGGGGMEQGETDAPQGGSGMDVRPEQGRRRRPRGLLASLERLIPESLPPMPRRKDPRYAVPGFPQDMMDMPGMMTGSIDLTKVEHPLARGMRNGWPHAIQGMMTTVRVLPDDLYEKVVSGQGEIEPGASVPGAGPGSKPGHGGHMAMPEHGQHGQDQNGQGGHGQHDQGQNGHQHEDGG